MGEREDGSGEERVGKRGVRAMFAVGERVAGGAGKGERDEQGMRRREKDAERVVRQGEKALLVHGALPRKPLFVLHPFARSSGSARE